MHKPPPLGPKKACGAGVKGYVAGYNGYLEETGVDGITDPACSGADWVRKIRQKDVYRRFYQLGILASSGAVIDGIVGATPVSGSRAAARRRQARADAGERQGLERLQPEIGSNAYGFGKEATDNGRGPGARQPALPLGRLRAPLPGAAADPRQAQRRGRLAATACRWS